MPQLVGSWGAYKIFQYILQDWVIWGTGILEPRVLCEICKSIIIVFVWLDMKESKIFQVKAQKDEFMEVLAAKTSKHNTNKLQSKNEHTGTS